MALGEGEGEMGPPGEEEGSKMGCWSGRQQARFRGPKASLTWTLSLDSDACPGGCGARSVWVPCLVLQNPQG